MWPRKGEDAPLRSIVRMLPQWCLGNSLVAALFWSLGFDANPLRLLAFTQTIGLSVESSVFVFIYLLNIRNFWVPSLAGVVVCLATGKVIAWLFAWPPMWVGAFVEWRATCTVVGLTLILLPTILYYFFSRNRLAEAEAARRDAEFRRARQESMALAAHLQMLQAQIEPHFLFNTLANLHTLLETDPRQAKALLEHLHDYLRATLKHSRSTTSTLWEECRLLANYLEIQALRMGSRLSWTLEVPEDLRSKPLPPMLLQPLVENAVIHGIEPKLGPGQITIRVSRVKDRICLAVLDDGVGFPLEAPGQGSGLDNVRERLWALFGANAEMRIGSNRGASEGVRAELWIPMPQEP